MANLRTAMDSAFWDLNIASPQNLDGTAKHIPGDPFPLDGARAGRVLRVQQVSLLGNGFPLGILPSYSPTSQNDLGSFSFQSLLLRPSTSNWWLGLIGQFRPRKLISTIKAEVAGADGWEVPALKDVPRHFLDKSLYSLGFCSQLSLGSSSSVLLNVEGDGERKKHRTKAMFFHKLSDHDITLEAAWPELFIDRNGGYWDVPESISLDLSSLISESGLRYRFGVHKNGGNPQAVNAIASNGIVPLALMPGICSKASASYEKSHEFWRQKETAEDMLRKTNVGWVRQSAYDVRLKEPHATISGIIGGTCSASFSADEKNLKNSAERREKDSISARGNRASNFSADLFGSVSYAFQHGKFRKPFGDLTRFDARLDICSASAMAKRVFNSFRSSSISSEENPLSSPRLNIIVQQQVAGPIVFRIDSKFALDSSSAKKGPQVEDMIYSLNYSLRALRSGKVVAWYSPKRKEGMVELRLFEF